MLQVDPFSPPKPLEFKVGSGTFQLLVRRFDAADRGLIMDAVSSGSLAEMFHSVSRLVLGWVNVVDPSGNPIPFERVDDKGRPVNQMNAVMGAAPMIVQLRVLSGLLAYVGVPTESIEAAIKAMATEVIDPSPTLPPDGKTQSNASGG